MRNRAATPPPDFGRRSQRSRQRCFEVPCGTSTQIREAISPKRLSFGGTIVLLLSLAHSLPCFAQTAQLRTSAEPYYSEVPITVQIVMEGFEESPSPSVEAITPVPGGTLKLTSMSPQVSQGVQIINGRTQSWKRVTWIATYDLTMAAPGPFKIPAFEIDQQGKKVTVQGKPTVAKAVPRSNDVSIELEFTERPVYPGQKIDVRVTLGFDDRFRERIANYTIRCPLFNLLSEFEFVDEPTVRGEQTMRLMVGGEKINVKAKVGSKRVGNRAFTTLSAVRTLIPLRSGEYELPPTTLVFEEVTRWKRDMFGRREAAATRLLFNKDLPRRVVVKDVPTTGRPASFAGAVGRGFEWTIEADRTVVSVGDPIGLRITLRGDGNLEYASLPPLIAAGLPASAFQIPDGSPPGIFESGEKRFEATIRPRDENISEIPPLDYSWFDPEDQTYHTAQSAPIALSVRRGERIGAESVIGIPAAEEDARDGIQNRPSLTGNSKRRISSDGADLALETSSSALSIDEFDRFGGALTRRGAYTIGLLSLLLACGLRLRSRVSPEVRARRSRLSALSQEVRSAAGDLQDPEVLRVLTSALRSMELEVKRSGGDTISGLQQFITDCEDQIYSPSSPTTSSDEISSVARKYARLLEEAGR